MMIRWAAAVATTLMAALPAVAAATPPSFPDLAALQAVDADAYEAPHGYATEGLRFATPDGLHCSLSHNTRGGESVTSCRGEIPGAGGATGVLSTSYVPTVWQQVDLSHPEMYLEMADHGLRDVPVDPESFKPLPVGSRIVFANITCGVTDAPLTACVIASVTPGLVDHGFVLQPGGSATF